MDGMSGFPSWDGIGVLLLVMRYESLFLDKLDQIFCNGSSGICIIFVC
jgi:hypothetical protein